MPETAPPVPDVDLAALIPAQRVPQPEQGPGTAHTPASAPAPGPTPAASPERLAFLWTLIGAVAGSALVAVAFLVLLTLLP